jgi:deazaflavin-dependent oxidoreductase (nitroreductase family)
MINGKLIPDPQGVPLVLLRLPLWLYRAGLGEPLNFMRIMVLATRGRKSGAARYTPIEYRRHGSKIYVISGWGDQPNWYQNILASPDVTLQLGKTRIDARATVVTNAGEVLRVLHLFRRAAPFVYDPVLARLGNRDSITPATLPDISDQFTIVRFDPAPETSGARLPTLPTDLAWVWFATMIVGVAAALIVTLTRPREP